MINMDVSSGYLRAEARRYSHKTAALRRCMNKFGQRLWELLNVALKHLLQCRFALAEREGGDARDLSNKWIKQVHKNCGIAAACICKAKHRADLRSGENVRKYAKRARNVRKYAKRAGYFCTSRNTLKKTWR